MNTEQYKYILAVAEYKSFSKAAENLFVTQPYLSKLVSSIENELGTQLFERSHNHPGREMLSGIHTESSAR